MSKKTEKHEVETEQVKIAILGKITPKAIFGGTIEIGKTAQLAGVVQRYETKTTTYGESLCFIGEFAAKPEGENVIYTSSKMYCPKILESLLETQLNAAAAASGEVAPLEFTFKLSVNEDTAKTSKTGYQFGIEVVRDFSENKPRSIALLN